MIRTPLLLAAAGCAVAWLTAAPTATATSDAVTIEHRYGTTTIEGTPERVVSLDVQWTDVLLAMDVEPAAYAVFTDFPLDDGLYPWQHGLLDGSTPIEVTAQVVPYERIAALDPDLIVVTHLVADADDYDQLAAIAPTIPLLDEDAEVDRWQDIVAIAGEILGDIGRAEEVVDGVDDQVAVAAAELPGLAGKTYALANYVPGDAIYVVADPDDGASALFSDLGMKPEPELLDLADGQSGRVTLSLEQAELLDADVLVLLTNGGDPHDLVGYDQLPAVRSGAVAVLDLATIVGLNTPTPLSIPYALEQIRPALEAAA